MSLRFRESWSGKTQCWLGQTCAVPACKTVFLPLLICLLLTAATQAQTSQILNQVNLEQNLNAQLPLDLEFQNSHGETVQLGDYFGERPVILQLVYFECPMLCNLTTDGLIRSLKILSLELGEDYEVLTVSFDPREREHQAVRTKQKIKSMWEENREAVEEHWHVLTGDEEAIRKLTEAVGFQFVYDEEKERFAHAAGIVVMTPDGRIARYLNGVEYSPKDVRYAVVEASEGKIGTVTDQVVLLCYQYDPTTGKYGWAIISGLRAGGLLTVLALAGGIVWMVRRDRTAQVESGESTEETT